MRRVSKPTVYAVGWACCDERSPYACSRVERSGAGAVVAASLGDGACNGARDVRHVMSMGITVNPERLRHEMARRGWTASRLARESGISPPTVSAALAGRAIAPHTLSAVASALARTPAVAGIDELMELGSRSLEGN
jgi:lambda repressor-like predicted transcriptional regulator